MNTKPKKIISPVVWLLFATSAVVFISTLFISNWTSTGPTFFSPQEVNSTVDRVVPALLQVPAIDWELLLPIVAVLSLGICLRFVRATNGTRLIVKSIVLFLAARYFIWRTVATLNFSHPASTVFSLTIYSVEVISFFSCCLYMVQTIWSTSQQRKLEADRYSQAVIYGEYLPLVDVLVPTYNEPDYIVRRTVIGCQAMEYDNKTIYILDDTRRPNIKALAQELGCEYITRPDNTHAKAGNLNNALKYVTGELIVPIDADFVPFKNFLTRTVGFFQNPEISLVQTPQYFYNSDYHSRNLGLENFLPNDLEHFYGLLQSNRDAGNSVICCGSSYVVRRSCLDAVGGYYTRCCVEDFQTSLRMLTQGFRLTYLNEVLSTGESTRTYIDFIDQRLRWLQGNFQVYFCGKDIPIWSKLNWIQKSYSVSQLIYCFQPVLRVVFILAPLCSAYLGISPFIATLPEVIYYFLPFWLLHIVVYGWATDYRVSYFWNEVYETIFCFPALRRLWLIVRTPFAKASQATRKGIKADRKNYNFNRTWPLIMLLALSGLIIGVRLIGVQLGVWLTFDESAAVLIFWLLYNSLLAGIAILSAIDLPIRRTMDRFPLQTICKITANDRVWWGYTQNLSESGAKVIIIEPEVALDTSHVEVAFIEHDFSVQAEIVRSHVMKKGEIGVALQFVQLEIEQQRKLVEVLYTEMTWWKQRKQPGSLDSFLAMISSIVQAKSLLNRYD
ncbi:glycosyltransferase [Chamaesiphon sp. OTE_20_metabat_361]|uniref:glycosyltransferase n=1 Tax=Chamaesiphon sp. OTE_20_metabat_361 TaxID=2964689 RepID=UPI00286C709D|nr:glycosyltransferase [Chamaesiphon sp. OTE_20_metabat_361]